MSETDLKNATDPASGQSEVENSGDSDLASLLSEYEEGTQPKAVTAPTPDLSKLAPVIKFAEQAMAASQKETFEKDVNSAVDTLSEDEAFKALPKTITRRMLIGYSFDNPNFDKAFEQRSQNPRIWDAALKEARSALAEEVKSIPFASTDRDDIEAAKAAVADGDTIQPDTGPSPTEMAQMSDVEWANFVAKELSGEAS